MSEQQTRFETQILAAQLLEFQKLKAMAEKAIRQLADEELFVRINPEQNSVSVIMRHMAGNMLSRFTEFLASDGEKAWRDREQEFIEQACSRAELMDAWAKGWDCMIQAVQSLTPDDLMRTVHIRNEPHTAFMAINRQVAHHAYHVGQILLIARHLTLLRGGTWDYVTIAPGKSRDFNRQMGLRA